MTKREWADAEVERAAEWLWSFVETHDGWQGAPSPPRKWKDADSWFVSIQRDLARLCLDHGLVPPPKPKTQGPPPWATWRLDVEKDGRGGKFVATWPVVSMSRRMLGTIVIAEDDYSSSSSSSNPKS